MVLFYKILPHRGKEIYKRTFLKACAAVLYPVPFAKGVPFADFLYLVPDCKTETAFRDIGDLRMRVAV